MKSNTRKVDHSFEEDSNWFIKQIISRKRVLPTFAHAGKMITDRTEKDLNRLVEAHAHDKTYDEKGRLESYVIAESFSKRHAILQRAFNDFAIFSVSLPKMAIVSVVSLFDAFLSRTLRSVYIAKPEILNACARQITLSELMDFGSIDNAREHIIDKEIETLLRDSHVAQFEWLSKRLDVKLTNLPSWKDFVELTERRNLLVHSDGRVSAHYIDTCKKHGIELEDSVVPNFKLDITPEYYANACNCVAEIGVKLGQVLWRKLLPSELKDAEASYIEICYDLLLQHDYLLAEKMLSISTEKAFKKVDAESGFYMTINLAISYKGQNKEKELKAILRSIDFSALSSKFKLANFVLQDNFEKAAELMRRIGDTEEITESNYTDWPLFRWFRKSTEFKSAFQDVYGKEFVIIKEALFTDDDDSSDEDSAEGTSTLMGESNAAMSDETKIQGAELDPDCLEQSPCETSKHSNSCDVDA
ncbi:hypothetical protein [Pseudomonas syringae]|uniref:hypothetical protein n=1 Tax=Pseudomonas syringae TaxID=317 RepID=UPI00320495EB